MNTFPWFIKKLSYRVIFGVRPFLVFFYCKFVITRVPNLFYMPFALSTFVISELLFYSFYHLHPCLLLVPNYFRKMEISWPKGLSSVVLALSELFECLRVTPLFIDTRYSDKFVIMII